MSQEHETQLSAAVSAVKNRKIKNVYFVACGGSMASLEPAQYIVDCELDIPSFVYSSNEFVHRTPKGLDKDSLVYLTSHSGTTPETTKAAELARSKGALTVGSSNVIDSPLWKALEFPIKYEWGEEATPEISKTGLMYRFLYSFMNTVSPNEKYTRALDIIQNKMKRVLDANHEATLAAAKEFGSSHKREELIYTMASGGCYGEAYSFAICLLMEMQWVNSHAIHSGEYFHGPFEITDYDVPFMIIKGLDQTRPLDERAHAFCQKYSKKITVIDAATFDMDGICEDLRGYFAPWVAGHVLRQYAVELGEHRGHPLSVRRYMWKMEY